MQIYRGFRSPAPRDGLYMTPIIIVSPTYLPLDLQESLQYNYTMSFGLIILLSFVVLTVVNFCLSMFLRYNLHWIVEGWWVSLMGYISRGLQRLKRYL